MNRDHAPTCPSCTRALDKHGENSQRLQCGGCEGMFITESEVEKLVAEAKKKAPSDLPDVKPLELGAPQKTEPARTCARCLATMTKHDLHGITIDRCAPHGIWFDREELQEVLHKLGVAHLRGRDLKNALATAGVTLVTATQIVLTILRLIR
ncbi:MAG: zf-TFIIB domain-containing protein [Kofleriaceae bacterium]